MSEGMTSLLPHVEAHGRGHFVKTKKCRTKSMRGAEVWRDLWVGRIGVWTVSTLWVSDWAVPMPDCAGFRMFGRESSVCKGWSPVRVPPRAQCFRR